LFPKKVELQQLLKYYDTNGDGSISYDEFLAGIRDSLSSRKSVIVERAFRAFDPDNTGALVIKDLAKSFRAPEGQPHDQAWNSFVSSFDGKNGLITKEEWFGYYTDLAVGIPHDEYFVRALEHTWGVSEDENSSVYKDEVKRIIGMLRQRLLTLTAKSYEEFTLRKIFKQFDLNNSNTITLDELAAMLAKLGIAVDRKYIVGMMKKLDTNGTGVIEFDEFSNLIVNDPYK
jgi:Ca2+-binding EF-hand superfamily protein